MIDYKIVLILLAIHFFADFVCQPEWMSRYKHKSNRALSLHCLVYAIWFIPISPIYAVCNGLLHFEVDMVTSRIYHKLLERPTPRWFFIAVGADQLIHTTILILSYIFLQQYF